MVFFIASNKNKVKKILRILRKLRKYYYYDIV